MMPSPPSLKRRNAKYATGNSKPQPLASAANAGSGAGGRRVHSASGLLRISWRDPMEAGPPFIRATARITFGRLNSMDCNDSVHFDGTVSARHRGSLTVPPPWGQCGDQVQGLPPHNGS